MKTFSILLFALTSLAVVGCGGQPSAPTSLPGQSAADAQATLAVYNVQMQATAETQARQTAVAAQATAAHEEMLRATAGAATLVAATATTSAESTADALIVRQTEVAVQMVVDSATAAAVATNTWATPTAAAQQTADAQSAANVALVQRDTEIKMVQQQRREETRLKWQPVLYLMGTAALVSVALACLGFVGFVLWRAIQLQRRPVIVVGDGMNVLQQSQGLLAAPKLLTITAPRAALPAGLPTGNNPIQNDEESQPIPLPRLRHGHVLVAGETGSGKSTAMLALLGARPRVVVLDPHSAGGDWGTARIVGAGRDFEAIREYMSEMSRMLRERYARRADGHTEFEPLTVAVDEMPAIVGAIGRDIEAVWREWLREGRKVGLFLALATQSTRVRTLGIEGERDLLENFGCVLVLGDLARQEYGSLVVGMEWPAVLRSRGQARPVIIPPPNHIRAEVGETAPEGRPMYIAQKPDYSRMLSEPDPDNLSTADKKRIVDSYRRTRTLAAVQREIFPSYGNSGGRAFYAIKDTLVEAGMLPPYRASNGSSGSSGLHVAEAHG